MSSLSMSDPFAFESGRLWQSIVDRSQAALREGALQPIETERHTCTDGNVPFCIHTVSSLARRKADAQMLQRQSQQTGRATNPFLPYEKALFVADLSPTHVCLLNKYPVIEHHALIVTRDFEPQDSALSPNDFQALAICMAEYDALAFYNGGPVAGASQPHKHLQLLPAPRSAEFPALPLLAAVRPGSDRLDNLPFPHAVSHLDASWVRQPSDAAGHLLLDTYRRLMGLAGVERNGMPPYPYNLLITANVMFLAPRRKAEFEKVAVNALGYAGSFFVSSWEKSQTIQRLGPMALLREVTGIANLHPRD